MRTLTPADRFIEFVVRRLIRSGLAAACCESARTIHLGAARTPSIRHSLCDPYRQVSLFTSFELPTIPSPTTALPFRHARFSTRYNHRRGLPRLSPGQTYPVEGIAVTWSRVRTLRAVSPTGLAESSSLDRRTRSTVPVVGVKLGRSFRWFQAFPNDTFDAPRQRPGRSSDLPDIARIKIRR
jgi:hypothetical protein